MSPRFVLGRENVPCVAEVVNRSLKADCTDFTIDGMEPGEGGVNKTRFSCNLYTQGYHKLHKRQRRMPLFYF